MTVGFIPILSKRYDIWNYTCPNLSLRRNDTSVRVECFADILIQVEIISRRVDSFQCSPDKQSCSTIKLSGSMNSFWENPIASATFSLFPGRFTFPD